MRILHVSQMYYPAVGGNEIHIKELSEKLVELGEDVTVFTSNALYNSQFRFKSKKIDLLPRENIREVNIRRFAINYRLQWFLFRFIPQIRGGYRLINIIFKDALDLLSGGPFVPKMIWEIIRFKPDLVMALNLSSSQSYFCYLAKKIRRFPLVVTPTLHIGYKWTEAPIIYEVMKSSDLILALTEYEKNYLVKKEIDANKIAVIGVGINPSNFTVKDGMSFRKKFKLEKEPIIAFIGRKDEGKGIDTLLDAMKYIWKKIPDARLVLAGANTIYNEVIIKRIMALDPVEREKIIIIDNFRDEDKSDIFDGCDIYAMPSRVDSFGITYLEAWIHGKPVVACKNTAPSTIISDGEDGLLVEYGNEIDLANAINKLLSDGKMRKEFGERGRGKVLNNYTWDIIANKIKQKYLDLVNGGNKLAYRK